MGIAVIEGQSYESFLKEPKLDFPLMIKSKHGGGGKGIRKVCSKDEFLKYEKIIKEEVGNTFSKEELYIEKYIDTFKHIEIQVIADKYGNVSALPERDCSCQRKYQKFIEESPSYGIDKKIIKSMQDDSIKIFKLLHYDNIGTVEFLLDKDLNYYFLEINARIQVEHAVSEEVTNINLVKEQISIADGNKNKYKPYIKAKKRAIECRINAENPDNNFYPSVGVINIFNVPMGDNLRVDTYMYQGYELKPHYDSLIYKVTVTGDTRKDVIKRLYNYLNEFIDTNVEYLIDTIDSKEFKKGDYSFFVK